MTEFAFPVGSEGATYSPGEGLPTWVFRTNRWKRLASGQTSAPVHRVANAGQQLFENLVYTPGFLEVLAHGVELPPTDYEAVNGNSVFVTKPFNGGELVSFKPHAVITALDAAQKSANGGDFADKELVRGNIGVGEHQFRNLLINALGRVNQRNSASGAATSTANQYIIDRWRVVVSGQSLSWTESENVRTMTAPAGGVEQVIEGLNILSGVHVMSWEGTAFCTINGAAVAKGGLVTLVGGDNCTVRFSGGTFAKPQLERGKIATPFAFLPFDSELIRCQRYYETGDGSIIGYGGQVGTFHFYKVTKRVGGAVTINIYGSSNYVHQNVDLGHVSGFRAYGVAGSTGNVVANYNWTSSAEL